MASVLKLENFYAIVPVLLEQTAANDPEPIQMTGEVVPGEKEGRGAVWPTTGQLKQSPVLAAATTIFFVLCSLRF